MYYLNADIEAGQNLSSLEILLVLRELGIWGEAWAVQGMLETLPNLPATRRLWSGAFILTNF